MKLWRQISFKMANWLNASNKQRLAELGREALDKSRYGMELKYLDGPEADVALKLSQAAAGLLTSLKDEKQACLRLGPLLLLKVTVDGNTLIMVETITPKLRRIFEINPFLFSDPMKMHDVLCEHRRLVVGLGNSDDDPLLSEDPWNKS